MRKRNGERLFQASAKYIKARFDLFPRLHTPLFCACSVLW